MAHATLRFYAELNDYLPAALRQRENTLDFRPPCPVRHLVEIMGVPHTEIEILLINGVSVDLEATVHDGDRISVYPVWEAMDVGPLLRLRDFPLRETRFFADVQLGRLARYLRLLGFDTLFVRDIDDVDLVRQAVAERRIVLTRDRDLLMRRAVTHGCHIRQDDCHSASIAFRELLRAICQNVGRFGHEMDTAKDNRLARLAFTGHLAELVAVSTKVSMCNDLILLIMMPKD